MQVLTRPRLRVVDGEIARLETSSHPSARVEITPRVVAEGAKARDGDVVSRGKGEIGRQEVVLGGIGEWVAKEIAARLGKDTRSLVLGHLQRGGSPTTFDRLLALRFGAAAVRLAEAGIFDHMVAWTPPEMSAVPLEDAICCRKKVDLESDKVLTAREIGICLGDSN